MQLLLSAIVSALLLLLSILGVQAETIYLKATVTGTCTKQLAPTPNHGKLQVTKINNQRIFDEFQVSKNDYVLVYASGNTTGLVLLPKRSSSMLPTIIVTATQGGGIFIDTNARVTKLALNIGAGSSDNNIFKGQTGEVFGTAYFQGVYPDVHFTKFVLSVVAIGTDTGGGNSQALLRYKFVTEGKYVPL